MRYAIAIFCFLIITVSLTAYGSHVSKHGVSIKPVSPSATLVFEDIIKPWIKNEFKKDVSDTIVRIDRTLLFIEFFRFEVIDGQDRYNVHIEWAQKLTEIATGDSYSGVKGQEVVFWIEDNKIKEWFPFDEYWIEYGQHLQT